MSQVHVPAVALAVVNKREILYAQGYGLTSVEEGGAPVSPWTLFRVGSVTKTLVGTAVMRLVEKGQLDLDQPLKADLEWLRFSEPHADDEMVEGVCISISETRFT